MQYGNLTQIHVGWPTCPLAEKREMTRTELPYPTELGQGWVDQLAISPGLMVHQTVLRCGLRRGAPVLPVGEFMLDFSEPTLSVHTLHTGTILSRELQPQTQLVIKPGQDLFRYCEQGRFVPMLDTSTDTVMTALVCSDQALHGLIGEDAGQQLLQDLGLAESPQVKLAPIPLHVSEPLRQCMSSGSSGALHALYAQSKILEYLWNLTTFTNNAKLPAKPSSREVGTLHALHDYLVQLEGDMPTLKELGSKFGVSPQSLNRGFMREYGQTIFSMVTSHRLTKAHKALLEGGLPIKTIATRMGYSHVNHFTHAFRTRYGYTPGSLRRKPQAYEQELELKRDQNL
jgi:AraC-like DNA-binding protein